MRAARYDGTLMLTTRPLAFICVQCRLRLSRPHAASSVEGSLLRSPSSTAFRRPFRSHAASIRKIREVGRLDRRRLSASVAVRSPEPAVQTDSPVSDFPVPPASAPHPFDANARRPARTKVTIRKHLKAWSELNAQQKAEQAETDFEQFGRATVLPNSLFIEEAKFNMDGDDEAAQEGDSLDEAHDIAEGGMSSTWKPGDLIYHQASGIKGRPQLAIFLGVKGTQLRFFLADGRWLVDDTLPMPSPVLRKFAPADEIAAVQQYLPVKPVEVPDARWGAVFAKSVAADVPEAAAARLMARFAHLDQGILCFQRENLELLDNVHEKIAHPDHYTTLSFDQLVANLLGQPYADVSSAARMAVYLALVKHSAVAQLIKISGLDEPYVILTPVRLAKRFATVCDWARDFQECAAEAALGRDVTARLARNPLASFIEKARRLILKSRQLRAPTTTGSLGPSVVQNIVDGQIAVRETGETFSDMDKMLLEFLWDGYIRRPSPIYRTRHHSIGSLIVRAIGAYPKLRLERKIGSLLLQELGVLPPWLTNVDQNVSLQIPGREGAHDVDRICAESDQLCQDLAVAQKGAVHVFTDGMAALRHDLGDLPVFCVDHASTVVRDDGYSLERSATDPNAHWIHVHVAHPSAFIDPTHLFARRAARLVQSMYHINLVHPMLPWDFAKSMGVGPDAPTLTISTLLGAAGEVQDIQIRPTRVHNVINLDPAAVAAALDYPQPELAYLVVGRGAPIPGPRGSEVSAAELAKAQAYQPVLQTLRSLALRRSEARRRENPDYARWNVLELDAETRTLAVEEHDPQRLYKSYFYEGDPAIICTASRRAREFPIHERDLGSELTELVMSLAAESAGRWFAERGIPAVFNGVLTQPGFPIARLNGLDKGRQILRPLGKISSSPIPHIHQHTASYLRMTSPLRRYVDLVAGWQADAHLLAEARGAAGPGTAYPFSVDTLDELIAGDLIKSLHSNRLAARADTRAWALRALFRAFHFGEAALPVVWELRVQRLLPQVKDPADAGIFGLLLPFGQQAKVVTSDAGWERGTQPGSFLPVTIELVDLEEGCVTCRAVGPPRPTQQLSDPITIVPTAERGGASAAAAVAVDVDTDGPASSRLAPSGM